jgi:hypothetical protein
MFPERLHSNGHGMDPIESQFPERLHSNGHGMDPIESQLRDSYLASQLVR